MPKFIFWCAFEHLDFRLPEFEAISELFNIELKWIDKNQSHPWVIIELNSISDAKLICSRSISTKFCAELWTQSEERGKFHENVAKYFEENKLEFGPDVSFKVQVESFMKKLSNEEKLERIESFAYMTTCVKGPVKLKEPDVIFATFEFYGFDHNNLPDEPLHLFFGQMVAEGQRDLIAKLSLKKRLFIGNTSMDPQLSLLMANLTKVDKSHLVFDPFVGTGSILLACAQFGAQVIGSDIDFLMVHARTKPSRVGQKKRIKGESFKGNFEQYTLTAKLLDVIVADASNNPWRDNFNFDAIVSDPPYGIREPAAKVGSNKAEVEAIPEEYQGSHIPQKIDYGLGDIFIDLLAFANSHLSNKSRLAFWIPISREFYSEDMLPRHPCFELVANCEQVLSTHTSRRCLVFEKTKETADFSEEEECRKKVRELATKFRENFYKAQEIPRTERKERIKKFGHLNLENTEENGT